MTALAHASARCVGFKATVTGGASRVTTTRATGTRGAKATRGTPARAMFAGFEKMLKGDPAEKTQKRYQARVDAVNALAAKTKALSDEELRAKTVEFRERLARGATVDDLLVEAFAVVREAADRVLGLRPFDVQLIVRMAHRTNRGDAPGRGRRSCRRYRRI